MEVPTELPPCAWPYVARRCADGSWAYVNVDNPKDVCRDFVPPAPEGWAVGWSGGQQSWFWRDCTTGEATLDAPEEGRVATRSRERLVWQLEEAGVLASGTMMTKRTVKKQYMGFCVKHHPDKRPDASVEEKNQYMELSNAFQ